MSYTLKQFPLKEYDLPAPPLWLTWHRGWDWRTNTPMESGQVRHHHTLQKAKKRVSPYGSDAFRSDWRIYKWDGAKYVEHYRGHAGQLKKDNTLFQMLVSKEDVVRELPEAEVEAAIKSILGEQ